MISHSKTDRYTLDNDQYLSSFQVDPVLDTESDLKPFSSLRIGDLLVTNGLVTEEQVVKALAKQHEEGHKKLLGEILVQLNYVSEEQVMEVVAEAYNIPFARISPKVIDPRVIKVLPRDFLEKQVVLPLFVVSGMLTVAVHEPSNIFLIEEMERLAGCSVQIVAATARDIQLTLQTYLPRSDILVIDEIANDLIADRITLIEKEVMDSVNRKDASGNSLVVRLVNYLVYCAVNEQVSDIHIEPYGTTLRVRYRVDGRLWEKMSLPYQMGSAIVHRVKMMASLDVADHCVPQHGGINVMIDKREVELRVSTMPARFGEKVVISVIDSQGARLNLEKLGLSFETLEMWRRVVKQPNGVVLITGPARSGKSTTLYSCLNEVARDDINISTVEDPVEVYMPGVNQFQANGKAGSTFAYGVRSLLRQDPDIIMVGAICDQDTARIVMQAALAGHLVFSSLHTNDAPSAITQLFDFGVEPDLVVASLRGVLAQRLLRKICTHCKEPISVEGPIRRSLEILGAQLPSIRAIDTLYHGTGCAKCRNTGYAGQIGIFELFVLNDETLDVVSRGASLEEIRHHVKVNGMGTLGMDGLEKVRAGLTTIEELFAATAIG